MALGPNGAALLDQVLYPTRNPPHFAFKFDDFLKREYKVGVDGEQATCEADRQGHCPLGASCSKKHDGGSGGGGKSSFNRLICKHWMRGLCKKGATCDFKHEMNLRDERECPEFARWQSCPNADDCLYLHVDPMHRRPLCPAFARGFCPLGPHCADRHVKRDRLCPFYLAGFCPDGKDCKRGAHAKWKDDKDLKKPEVFKPKTEEELQKEAEERERQQREEEEREIQREEQRERNFTGDRRGGKEWRGRRRRHGPARVRR